jgi:carboxyl-terminal processing protease
MKDFLQLAAVLIILTGGSAYGQGLVSKLPVASPFKIDEGSSFSASGSGSRARNSNVNRADILILDIREAMSVIRGKHAGASPIPESKLTKSSIEGMLAELDPHSTYFDPAEFSELLGEQESEYSGTGSTITNYVKDGAIETYIIATQPDSPAAKARLQYGDRIVAVDGVPVSGMVSEQVRNKVRGPRGTDVRLSIERAATGKAENITLRRDRVFQPTLPNFFVVRDGVGYIDLSEGFSHTTSAEFEAAMTELRRRGMTSLILDLRGNSGGILDQAIKVAEKFLPAGSTIISQRGRYAYDTREWRSANHNPEKLATVILVDGQTASASEVVAGALQDNDRALILGQTTFGKGLVQNVVPLPMGSGLTLTTARYYTPSGRSIQRTYADTGMYDYFNHRSEKDQNLGPETRTVTNRRLGSGSGITPDETTTSRPYSKQRAKFLDPMFFFVRGLVADKASGKNSLTTRQQVRQSMIFGGKPAESQLIAKFREYVVGNAGWNISDDVFDKNSSFIAERLSAEVALAAFGPGAAKKEQIVSDPEVLRAIELLPRAALLAETARQTRNSIENKKARRVASPTGQGRNRRN